MKISEVVKELLELQEEHGDIDVVSLYSENVAFVKYFSYENGDDDTVLEYVEIY